jgi:hypothetical protein
MRIRPMSNPSGFASVHLLDAACIQCTGVERQQRDKESTPGATWAVSEKNRHLVVGNFAHLYLWMGPTSNAKFSVASKASTDRRSLYAFYVTSPLF